MKTFGQKQLMKAKYQVIGNGVYELEQHQGFVLVKEDHLQLKLSEKNPLIFEEYLIFAKF